MKVLLSVMVFWVGIARAADVSVTMSAEKTQISLEDELEIQVVVQGTRENIDPVILNRENFEVQSSGTSSQFQVINGQVSQQISFNFLLSPKNTGKFKIGPAQVTVNGNQYQSNAIEVTVGKGAPVGGAQERSFYVVGEVDNKSPYVHQQVNYTFKFFNRGEIGNAQLGLPEFKGFLKEGPDKQRESEEIVNGVRWHVTTLRFALFPMEAGPIQIEPARLAADAIVRSGRDSLFEGFFAATRAKRVTLKSEPLQLNVNPLPTEGRPASFSGLVGQFNLTASLGKQTLAVGDSSTLTVTMQGNGNLRDFALPDLKSDEFKLYDDQPAFTLIPGAKEWTATKTFKRALVPVRGGDLVIAPIQIAYFDPQTKAYKTMETQKFSVSATGQITEDSVHHVAPAGEASSKKSIEVVGKDLMPIKRLPASLRADVLRPQERWLLLLLFLLCPPAYLAIFLLKRRRDKLSSNAGLSRKRKAYKEFSTRLKQLNQTGSFFSDASLLLRDYLGNKFDLDGKAITSMDADRKLTPHRISKDAIKKIEAFLRECEAAQYGGGTPSDQSGRVENLLSIVQEVEKEARS